jgi:hypothetical protein
MNNTYPITKPLVLPERANPRFADLTTKESRGGGRVVGGDRADLYFFGYECRGGSTHLTNPELVTGHDWSAWTAEELHALADQILKEAYASIGIECVEHS